jgi:glutamate racemase
MLGPGVKLIDSAHNTALETKNILAQNNLLNNSKAKGKIQAYTSDAPKHFEILAKAILNQKSIKAELAK